MEASDHDHLLLDEPVEKGVWKSNEHSATSVSMHDGIEFWHLSYGIQRSVDLREEFLSQAGPLRFIPQVCFVDFCRRSRPDYEGAQRARFRMR